MKKTKISGYFLFMSIFTFLVILVTIVQKSYSSLMGPIKKIETTSYERITDTSLDLEIIDEIETRSINFNQENSDIINYLFSLPATSSSSLLSATPSADSL